jgi:hypothetical protein
MAIEAQFRCTDAKPIIHRASGGVAGWECRIEVIMIGATGFDFICVAAPEPWKPESRWTRAELFALVEAALPTSNKFKELVGIVQFRREYRIDESSTLLIEKGREHELTGPELPVERRPDRG